jgi:hypothetical protein
MENLTRSKQRILEHGEVFTPKTLVDKMLNLVHDESYRIDSRFLEPACGSGNFLCAVLLRKLNSVQKRYQESEFEFRNYALLSLMCIYGIELLEDNAVECRKNLLQIFNVFLEVDEESQWTQAARNVLNVNIICGDALTLKDRRGLPITFPEWGYLGNGMFQRRDFLFAELTQRGDIKGTLFEFFSEADLFVPVKVYEPVNVKGLSI